MAGPHGQCEKHHAAAPMAATAGRRTVPTGVANRLEQRLAALPPTAPKGQEPVHGTGKLQDAVAPCWSLCPRAQAWQPQWALQAGPPLSLAAWWEAKALPYRPSEPRGQLKLCLPTQPNPD